MKSRTVKILATAALVLGAVAFLAFSSAADGEYYKYVQDVLAEPTPWLGKNLQVHGIVEPGSIHQEIVGQKTQRTFVLDCDPRTNEQADQSRQAKTVCEPRGKHRLLVRSSGPVPDTFKDLAEVLAKGTLVREGDVYVMNATELSAKCPSKYKEDRPSQIGKTGQPGQTGEADNATGYSSGKQ
jgi:cytochrome c-type biogenesis protein CcmE